MFWRRSPKKITQADIERHARNWERASNADFIRAIKLRSMLHYESLAAISFLASVTAGGILEIGAYIGGATTTIALAKQSRSPLVTVELGGTNDNPYLPSGDILRDLRETLASYDVLDRVNIVSGWSN